MVLSPEAHIFESIMLVCFGCSWPFAIAKTIRTRSVQGKSLVFITLIFIGYVAGIVFKLIGRFDHVIWLYVTNGTMVFTEIVLYLRYDRHGTGCRRPAARAPWRIRETVPLRAASGGSFGWLKHTLRSAVGPPAGTDDSGYDCPVCGKPAG